MRFWMIAAAVALLPSITSAQVYVHGYYRSNGTYVAPHYRSAADGNPYNNWSTVGNVNPYTGQEGTKNPYSSYGSTNGTNGSYPNPYSSNSTQPSANSSKTCIYFTPC
jgi:hypothetical protein